MEEERQKGRFTDITSPPCVVSSKGASFPLPVSSSTLAPKPVPAPISLATSTLTVNPTVVTLSQRPVGAIPRPTRSLQLTRITNPVEKEQTAANVPTVQLPSSTKPRVVHGNPKVNPPTGLTSETSYNEFISDLRNTPLNPSYVFPTIPPFGGLRLEPLSRASPVNRTATSTPSDERRTAPTSSSTLFIAASVTSSAPVSVPTQPSCRSIKNTITLRTFLRFKTDTK